MKKRSGLTLQVVLLLLATLLAQVLVAILYILAARGVSKSEYGDVVSAIALGGAIVGLVDFGTNALWVREFATERLSYERFRDLALTKILVAVVVAVLFACFALALKQRLGLGVGILLGTIAFQTAVVPLRAQQRGDLVAGLMLSERALGVLSFAILYRMGFDSAMALGLALPVGSLGTAAVAVHISRRVFGVRGWHRFRVVSPWRGAANFGVSSLLASFQALDVSLLNVMGGAAAAGVYGAVNRWTQPIGLLASSYSAAASPMVAQARSWSETWSALKKSVWLLGLAIVGAVGVAFSAPLIVTLLLGEEYRGSQGVLSLLAIGTVFSTVNQPLAAVLQVRGMDRAVARGMGVSVVIQMITVAFTAGQLGALGAAAAFVLMQCVLLGWLVAVCIRTFRAELGQE